MSGTYVKNGVATTTTGSSALNITSKTANYTASITDGVILCSGSSFTITLPTAVGNSGKQLSIKKTDSSLTNIITIDGNGSETINGKLTVTCNTQDEEYTIVSDGSNWQLLAHVIPGDWVSFTPTFNNNGGDGSIGNGTLTGKWRRVGTNLEAVIDVVFGTTTAMGTTGFAIGYLPSGATLDTSIINTSINTPIYGLAFCQPAGPGNTYYQGAPQFGGTGVLNIVSNGTSQWKNSVPAAWSTANQGQMSLSIRVPITGWGG